MLLSSSLFLWMFLAAEPLEVLADLNLIHGPAGLDASSAAYLFAARWRHGMTEGWLLYMPGFFAVAAATWLRYTRRSNRQMAVETAALIPLACIIAMLAQPAGAAWIIRDFEQQTAFRVVQSMPGFTLTGVIRGIYTLLTFQIGITAIQRCLALRRLWPLVVPIAMNVILALVRPWTVADFTGHWAKQVMTLDPVANFSFWLIPILAWILYRSQRSIQPDGMKITPDPNRITPALHEGQVCSNERGIEAFRDESVDDRKPYEEYKRDELKKRQTVTGVHLQSMSRFPTGNIFLHFPAKTHQAEDEREVCGQMQDRDGLPGQEDSEQKA
jgi:hypothetical protein